MSNKKVVKIYIEGFNEGDHGKILSCLTEDVVWEMPGYFYLTGKEQFDKEIENDAFEGKPMVGLTRMIEEGEVVVAEGAVISKMKSGASFHAVFCDVFHFRQGKIRHLTTYLMQKNA
jgi:ketosteroid isomerase-like protein